MDRWRPLLNPGAISPLEPFKADWLTAHGIECWVKRDDLLALAAKGDPHIFSGNKWRKLKYNLMAAAEAGQQQLLTFGGAYSNHIAAVAAAGVLFDFQTVGIIRGERVEPLNPTLAYAESCGMQLHFVSRLTFRQKNDLLEEWELRFGKSYVLPEGGTNELALKGAAELVGEIESQLGELPDSFHLCCGTGGTAAGLIEGLQGRSQVIGYSVLRGHFQVAEIESLTRQQWSNWEVATEFHHGGYAKTTDALLEFIRDFPDQYGFHLDPIYTGKLFWAFRQKVTSGQIPAGSRVVLIHSGGVQGIRGFNQRFGADLPVPAI